MISLDQTPNISLKVLAFPPVPELLGENISTQIDWSVGEALWNTQGKPATEEFTCQEWTELCRHLHNQNSQTGFVMGFQENGAKKYVKSKTQKIDKCLSWAWSSMQGKGKTRMAFAPYCFNRDTKESRWGAIDFDGHDGNCERARRFAYAAFHRLLECKDLFLILESTGSGWHVWAISKDFHPVNNWIRLLKQVTHDISAPIQSGICEIFPPDSYSQGLGLAVRAPGSWNPGTGKVNQILWHNIRPLLASIRLFPARIMPEQLTDIERNTSFISSSSPEPAGLYKLWSQHWAESFAITVPSTRNQKLCGLVGEMFHQVGQGMAQRIVEEQFKSKTVETNASLQEHLESSRKLWAGLEESWRASLSLQEQLGLNILNGESERDAFRIILSFYRKAQQEMRDDFPISITNLGERIGISKQAASRLRQNLVKKGILAQTKAYEANKAAARFRWLASAPVVRTNPN